MSKLSLLQPYITKDEPFGPIDAFEIGASDIEVLKLLFEKQNRIYKLFRDRPSIITGRRGSGKTSYLRSVYFDDRYNDYVEISTANVLGRIVGVVQELSNDTVFTETLWKLWEETFWTCALARIDNKSILGSASGTIIEEYLRAMNINTSDSSDVVLYKLADIYKAAIANNPKDGLTDVLKQFEMNNFEGAKSVATAWFKAKGKRIVILLDSLEDFRLNILSVDQAIQGLLRCIGAMNNPREVLDVRLCIPTEMTSQMFDLSSNAIKDFNRQVKLEWTSKELISIGAQRLMYYIGLYYPHLLHGKSPLDELTREEAQGLFRVVLPEWITNQSGFQEQTISYILRHTQLLPRHFLILLNSIFKRASGTQLLNPFPIKQDKIIYGIRQVEERIVKEIFGAFRMVHPSAEEVCKRCLPQLGHVFSVGALRQVFNRFGKAVFQGAEYFQFQQMLIDIGAIGRVTPGLETDAYIKGKFKYTIGHDLVINSEDKLCMHPLFSGIYASEGNHERPVYPDGSSVEDQDYRNIEI